MKWNGDSLGSRDSLEALGKRKISSSSHKFLGYPDHVLFTIVAELTLLVHNKEYIIFCGYLVWVMFYLFMFQGLSTNVD
jgi:hypothetical protein